MHTNEKRGKKKTQIWTQHARKPRESNGGEGWGTQKKIETLREKTTKWTYVEAKIEAFSENEAHENHINRDRGKNRSFF